MAHAGHRIVQLGGAVSKWSYALRKNGHFLIREGSFRQIIEANAQNEKFRASSKREIPKNH